MCRLFTTLGQMLRHHRLLCGLRQADLAAIVGISQSYVCAIENGRTVLRSPDLIQRLAVSVGADPVEMLALAGFLHPHVFDVARRNPHLVHALMAGVELLSETARDTIEDEIKYTARCYLLDHLVDARRVPDPHLMWMAYQEGFDMSWDLIRDQLRMSLMERLMGPTGIKYGNRDNARKEE